MKRLIFKDIERTAMVNGSNETDTGLKIPIPKLCVIFHFLVTYNSNMA